MDTSVRVEIPYGAITAVKLALVEKELAYRKELDNAGQNSVSEYLLSQIDLLFKIRIQLPNLK